MSRTTLRAAGLVTLVIAALLGSAYALGRSLVPEQQARRATGVTAGANSPHYADQPPSREFPAPPPDSPSPTRSDSAPPAGDAGDGPYGSRISTGSSRIALTFDDGPDPQYTPQVLALLKEYGVKATFCVVGENAENHPDLIQAIVNDGHTLCNHSWNHDENLGKRSPDAIRADLLRTSDAIHAAAPDARIAYYRQPGGNWTSRVVSTCEDLGMTPLHWAVDPADWTAPGAQKIINTVMTQVEPGSIVLMHDAGGNRSGTVQALQYLLPELLDRYQLEALPVGST
ncbi:MULTISPECIES: polysaccharide deacetylase family protein [Micromonospora]|uniref:Polysaccharide deacetylase family protein n=1 Tax=Micromonospora solifontis TaxID=2487138 RepID=A0ABX9WIT9_9ACTN|nr:MULTISPECIES: polysaccharide deacetylase family protein [Micromonospora]NES15681.1 polysaccharide deacetylase family protein [Micromonospora sp. PPF5-17B]NES35981.1 polysaccharide deacetylase family protein [Micromonospora solifontis]NES56946.1 polysaccharide deacetylase family protein [Micromonospora sp. PPF5-6]RNM00088.1 polysaccharide deacetylase family protein [Micromonospora solifontis]